MTSKQMGDMFRFLPFLLAPVVSRTITLLAVVRDVLNTQEPEIDTRNREQRRHRRNQA